MMIWFAHAGDTHITNSDSLQHLLKTDFIKIALVTIVFVSIIVFLAYLSQRNIQPKDKEQSDE